MTGNSAWAGADDYHGAHEFGDDEPGGIGCYECQQGWRHGCCDDMCRGCNEAVDCDAARPCQTCNPDGELPF